MKDLAANSRQFSTALLQKQMKASSQVLILMTQTLNFVQTAGRTLWFRAALPLYPLNRSFFFTKHTENVHSLCFLFPYVLAFQLLQRTTDFFETWEWMLCHCRLSCRNYDSYQSVVRKW